jgi:hypothetical protein
MGKRGLILVLLLAGCAKPSGNYCDIASPLYFDSNEVVDYLSQKDENLLRDVVIHNETWQELCD